MSSVPGGYLANYFYYGTLSGLCVWGGWGVGGWTGIIGSYLANYFYYGTLPGLCA